MWPSGLALAMTLTLHFQDQIWNLLYLSQKWCYCHETKSKHIDWSQGLKCDHRVWPWPWPWPWILKVKHRICYISAKNGPIATKWKANISIEHLASNVTIRFDLGHDLARSNMEFAISQPKVVRLPGNEKQTYRLNSRPQMWPMGLTLAMTLIFEFSRSDVTIWWPGSGVRICQIVTGVTSDVGVPSTHLVFLMVIHIFGKMVFILKHGPAWKGLMELPFYFFQANVFTLILMIISYGHPIYIHYWTRQQRRQLGNHRSTIYKPAEEPQEEVSPLKPDVETWYCFKGDMMFQIKTFLSSLYLNLFVTYFGTVELVVYCVIH